MSAQNPKIDSRWSDWVIRPFRYLAWGVGLVAALVTINTFVRQEGLAPPIQAITVGTGTCLFAIAVWLIIRSRRIYLNRVEVLTNEVRDRKRFISDFLLSLPKLFQKTTHVRRSISSGNLNRYRESLKNTKTKVPVKASYVVDGLDLEFISTSVKQLLTDLREAIQELTHDINVMCSIKFVAEGGLVSVYGHSPLEDRRIDEEKYLAGDSLEHPRTVIGKAFEGEPQTHCFDSIDDLSVFGKSVVDHWNASWANTRINSLSLCPVVIELSDKETVFAVIQVDSPKFSCCRTRYDAEVSKAHPGGHSQYSGAIMEMLKCTADAIGAIVSVAIYVNDRFRMTQQIEDERNEALKEFTRLRDSIKDLETVVAERDAELERALDNNRSLDDAHGDDASRSRIVGEYSSLIEQLTEELIAMQELVESDQFSRKTKVQMVKDICTPLKQATEKLSSFTAQGESDGT